MAVASAGSVASVAVVLAAKVASALGGNIGGIGGNGIKESGGGGQGAGYGKRQRWSTADSRRRRQRLMAGRLRQVNYARRITAGLWQGGEDGRKAAVRQKLGRSTRWAAQQNNIDGKGRQTDGGRRR